MQNYKYSIPGKKSINTIKESLKYIGNTHYAGLYGICLEKGVGSKIFDIDGNVYIDMLASGSVANVGYANKKIIQVLNDQAKKIQHTMYIYSPNESALVLAKEISKTFPYKKRQERIKVLFGMSGSDANEAAIKCARKFTKKKKIISFIGAWHGAVGFSQQANGFPSVKEGMQFPKDEFILVPFPSTRENAAQAVDVIKSEISKGDVAAVIVECIQGDGGNLFPYGNVLKEIAAIIQGSGGLFIVDEVQSGNGRSGKYWEVEHFDIKPDLLTSAKAITGGYFPLSICMGRREIIDSLDKAQHVFTYTANPIGCAVALETVKTINSKPFLAHVNKISAFYQQELAKLVQDFNIVKEFRGLGLHLGLEVRDDNKPYAGILGFMCAQRGVYFGYFGLNNEVLRIHPCLTITEDEAKKSIKVLRQCLHEITENGVDKKTLLMFNKHALGLVNGNNKKNEEC